MTLKKRPNRLASTCTVRETTLLWLTTVQVSWVPVEQTCSAAWFQKPLERTSGHQGWAMPWKRECSVGGPPGCSLWAAQAIAGLEVLAVAEPGPRLAPAERCISHWWQRCAVLLI